MSYQFSEAERAVLRIVQGNLPNSLTPYADIAREAGVSEEDVLSLLRRLKEDGAIRRFGASIKHQKTGWTHNAMVAWKASETEAEACGPV
ncbi:MAG: Lrp/AsnC family transcriptional regulator, partial [Desulfovibrionaceae bacterium]|nr:Lrp/AsnC family transcriptional regulator [Desulfovibrionaceae bacterium]